MKNTHLWLDRSRMRKDRMGRKCVRWHKVDSNVYNLRIPENGLKYVKPRLEDCYVLKIKLRTIEGQTLKRIINSRYNCSICTVVKRYVM